MMANYSNLKPLNPTLRPDQLDPQSPAGRRSCPHRIYSWSKLTSASCSGWYKWGGYCNLFIFQSWVAPLAAFPVANIRQLSYSYCALLHKCQLLRYCSEPASNMSNAVVLTTFDGASTAVDRGQQPLALTTAHKNAIEKTWQIVEDDIGLLQGGIILFMR